MEILKKGSTYFLSFAGTLVSLFYVSSVLFYNAKVFCKPLKEQALDCKNTLQILFNKALEAPTEALFKALMTYEEYLKELNGGLPKGYGPKNSVRRCLMSTGTRQN